MPIRLSAPAEKLKAQLAGTVPAEWMPVVPHQVNIEDFSIKAQALKELPAPVSKAAKGY